MLPKLLMRGSMIEPRMWKMLKRSSEVSPHALRFIAMPTTMGSDLKCSTKVPKIADITTPLAMPKSSPMNAFSKR